MTNIDEIKKFIAEAEEVKLDEKAIAQNYEGICESFDPLSFGDHVVYHRLGARYQHEESKQVISPLTRALTIAVEALDRIACWREGNEVDDGFDSPWNARDARSALIEIAGVLKKNSREI